MYKHGALICTTVSAGSSIFFLIKRRNKLVTMLVSALKSTGWTWAKLGLDNGHCEQHQEGQEANGTVNASASSSERNVLQPCVLRDSAQKVISMLRTRLPRLIEGVPGENHEQPPHIRKQVWEDLGALVRAKESSSITEIPGQQWISLRLDGCGFSKQTRRLRKEGVLESGYSADFGEIMKECVQLLLETFHGCLGYTQSDEMTVLIPPASVVRGEQQCHLYRGRVQKLCSTAASTVTALFNRRVFQLAAKRSIVLCEDFPLSHFDCRVGTFESEEEALALVLWRSQDCGVNGVSDAVHHCQGSGKQVKMANGAVKLAWLAEQGRLPLPAHQAYGSLFLVGFSMKEGTDPRTGECKTTMRRMIYQANNGESGRSRCVLNLMAHGELSLTQHGTSVSRTANITDAEK